MRSEPPPPFLFALTGLRPRPLAQLALSTGSLLQGFQTLPVIALGAAASVAAVAAGAIALLLRGPDGNPPFGD